MDTELLRTFLEIRRTRHFAKAAQNLFLTQAAVSARIKQLEDLIGQKLFTRNRNNIQLTAAGNQLVPYAESMLAAWSRALLETANRHDPRALVVLGCLPSLGEIYLQTWLTGLLDTPRNWFMQIDTVNTAEMIASIRENNISLGILYEPPRASDLWAEKLTSFDLKLVASSAGTTVDAELPSYIYVDWGSSFEPAHNTHLAEVAAVSLKTSNPVLAHHLLLKLGGCAFLPSPMIEEDLRDGKLYEVEGSPVVTREVYLVGRRDLEGDGVITEVRNLLLEKGQD